MGRQTNFTSSSTLDFVLRETSRSEEKSEKHNCGPTRSLGDPAKRQFKIRNLGIMTIYFHGAGEQAITFRGYEEMYFRELG